MAESRQVSAPWQPDDVLESQRLEMTRQLAESAQLVAASKNVRVYKSPNGAGTAIAVDEAPPSGSASTLRLAVVEAPEPTTNPRLLKCATYPGPIRSTDDYDPIYVAATSAHGWGDEIFAHTPTGGTGVLVGGDTDVTLMELGNWGQPFYAYLRTKTGDTSNYGDGTPAHPAKYDIVVANDGTTSDSLTVLRAKQAPVLRRIMAKTGLADLEDLVLGNGDAIATDSDASTLTLGLCVFFRQTGSWGIRLLEALENFSNNTNACSGGG